jgi:SecD/SecF fusion protein
MVDALGSERSLESLANFDAAMTTKATQRAIIAIILSWLAIIGYLWLRFGSAQWGLAAVICLIHDTLIVVGLVGICGFVAATPLGEALMIDAFKIDLAIIAAVLTVIGYSVNDTIVVFDRIRENMVRVRDKSLRELINLSTSQMLSRTIVTSLTTLLSVSAFFILGTGVIQDIAFALGIGIVIGTVSSIFIAAPITELMDRRLFSRVRG